jgi:hypothetical protein
LRLRQGGARKQQGERRTGGGEKVTMAHGFLPEGVFFLLLAGAGPAACTS